MQVELTNKCIFKQNVLSMLNSILSFEFREYNINSINQ